MSKNHCFESLSLSDLNLVIGGADGDRTEFTGEVTAPGVSGRVTYKPAPSPPASPESDKQLRCYKQFADQAHWYDSSNTTFNHQMVGCGPLRP